MKILSNFWNHSKTKLRWKLCVNWTCTHMNVHLRNPDASWIWAMCANFVPGWFLHEIEKSAPTCHIFAQNMAPCSFHPPPHGSVASAFISYKQTYWETSKVSIYRLPRQFIHFSKGFPFSWARGSFVLFFTKLLFFERKVYSILYQCETSFAWI